MGLIVLVLYLLSCTAWAASTADATDPIDTDRSCTLTLSYACNTVPYPNQTVALYHIAQVSADFQYTLTSPFAACGLTLNGVQTQGEWNVIRSTLESLILGNQITPIKTAETDATGQVQFADLAPGLYLSSAVQAEDCSFAAALVALPGLGAEGKWEYACTVVAKGTLLPPQPEPLQFQVLKLWRGDEGKRPGSITVDIYRNGVLHETVTLSEGNNWSYRWSAEDDGARWQVVEKAVPEGYTMTVEQRETSFTITNILHDRPDTPPPDTGDRSNVLLYAVIFCVSGILLVALGLMGKGKGHEETV